MLLAGRERPALVFVRPPSSIDTHKYVDLYETNGVASHPPPVTPNAPHIRRLVLQVSGRPWDLAANQGQIPAADAIFE